MGKQISAAPTIKKLAGKKGKRKALISPGKLVEAFLAKWTPSLPTEADGSAGIPPSSHPIGPAFRSLQRQIHNVFEQEADGRIVVEEGEHGDEDVGEDFETMLSRNPPTVPRVPDGERLAPFGLISPHPPAHK